MTREHARNIEELSELHQQDDTILSHLNKGDIEVWYEELFRVKILMKQSIIGVLVDLENQTNLTSKGQVVKMGLETTPHILNCV